MRTLITVCCVVALLSCKKEKKAQASLPTCIKTEIASDSTLVVKTQVIKGQVHYWLNTGAAAWDGPEFIVDGNCNEVCQLPVWTLPPCFSDYNPNGWTQVWP